MGRIWFFRAVFCITSSMILMNSGCNEPNSTTSVPTQSRPKTPPPEIKFEETNLDFGKLGPKSLAKKEIKFQNSGPGVLIITDIIQCCGLSASVDKEQYEPNETGILKIQLQVPGVIGTFEKELKVHSNDPVNPKIIIKVTAEVMQKVLWEPENIKLFLDEENAACPKLTIKCIDGQEFAITGIRSTGNCITGDYNPTIKKTEHIINLKVDMEKLPEQMNGEINVLMNHPEGTIATVFFKVVQKYETKPSLLTFRNLIENEHRKETIQILSNYNEDFEIESTSSKNNTVKMIDYKKIENGYEMIIEIIPPLDLEDKTRVIDTFYINIKDEKQLALECYEYYKK
ncbi:MAG: DUF1573 domain-containing protein [Sedimentisphaerales bacterium]|nr:DUF1573 domain-containing protein [Sedimentisphaerales bacterium]